MFVGAEADLEKRDRNGVSLRKTYEDVYNKTGKLSSAIAEQPSCPDELLHVWGWFEETTLGLNSCNGREPLTYRELHSWAQLTGNNPTPFEVELILAADSIIRAKLLKDKSEK